MVNFFQTPQQALAARLGVPPVQSAPLPPPEFGPAGALQGPGGQGGDLPSFDPTEEGRIGRQQALAKRLVESAGSGPVATPLEGVGRLAKVLTGTYLEKSAGEKSDAITKRRSEFLSRSLTGEGGKTDLNRAAQLWLGSGDPELAKLALPVIEKTTMSPKDRYQAVGDNLIDLGAPGGPKPAYESGPKKAALPPTRSYDKNGNKITEELQPDGTYKQLGTSSLSRPTAAMSPERYKQEQGLIAARQKAAIDRQNAANQADPEAVQATVDLLGKYKGDPRSVFSGTGRNRPFSQAVIKGLAEQYPKFDQTNYQSAQRMRNNYTSGNTLENRTINAASSAAQHISVLRQIIDATKNGDLQGANYFSQMLAEQLGSSVPTNLKGAGQIVGTEVMKMLAGVGAGSVEERKKLDDMFKTAASTKQLTDAADLFSKLMAGQLNTLSNKWGKYFDPSEFEDMLQPEALDMWNNFGGKAGGPRKPQAADEVPPTSEIDAEIARRSKAAGGNGG